MSGPLLGAWEGRDVAAWRAALGVPAVYFHTSIASTNDEAARLAAGGAPHSALVVADHQTHGRGRSGASWFAAPAQSLLFSVVLRYTQAGPAPGGIPIRAGLAVCHALARCAGVEAAVKWPNDVILPGHGKVAGILCEGALGPHGGYIVVGIGINVLQTAESFPADVRDHACSIRSATGRIVSRGDLLAATIAALQRSAPVAAEPLDPDELAELRQRDVLCGHAVTFQTALGEFEGLARGIAPDGSLLVERGGVTERVYNASVRLADAHRYPGTGG